MNCVPLQVVKRVSHPAVRSGGGRGPIRRPVLLSVGGGSRQPPYQLFTGVGAPAAVFKRNGASCLRAVSVEEVSLATHDIYAAVRGDTQGAAVVIEDGTVTIGDNDVLEGEKALLSDTRHEHWDSLHG